MLETTRRRFLCGCSAAIAGLAGSRLNSVAFAGQGAVNKELLVILFLRGGQDGLSLVPPISGSDRGFYSSARPNVKIPLSGPNKALTLNSRFGLHGAAAPLHELYQDGKLAIIPAAGMHTNNRSHFDSMRYMELGTPGQGLGASGWLARHLNTADNLPSEITMPALAAGSLTQAALLGSSEVVNMSSPSDFSLNTGPYEWQDAQRFTLRRLLGADSTWLHDESLSALDAVDVVELSVEGGYSPSNGADYPNTTLGRNFEMIAQMLKLDLGLRVATLDYGGWDMHNGLGDDGGGQFASRMGEVANSMAAFYLDLDGGGKKNYTKNLTVVVMSEFGRRLSENADGGVDHGHGSVMMVMSGNAIKGVHGKWPGLRNDELFDGADVAVTTDYRRVLTEILINRMGNDAIDQVFPGYTGYAPLGVVVPRKEALGIFNNGFESGSTGAWGQEVS